MRTKRGLGHFAVYALLISLLIFSISSVVYGAGYSKNGLFSSKQPPIQSTPSKSLRVGVYNFKPLVFMDADGHARGLYIDVLNYIAEKENWEVKYVPCQWADCLAETQAGELDILPSIGYTEERAQTLDYTKDYLFLDWGVIYENQNQSIETVLDLEGKHIAALEGSIYTSGLMDLLEHFGIQAEIVSMGEYADVLAAVDSGEVDAGIVTKIYGLELEKNYDNIRQTQIFFSPVKIYFAVPKEKDPELLETLDRYFYELKNDENSYYHQSFNKWMGFYDSSSGLPQWAFFILISFGGLFCATLLFTIVLRKQVATRTASLKLEIEERKRAEVELLEKETQYRYLADSGTALIWTSGTDKLCNYFNQPWLQFTGREIEQELGNGWAEGVHPDDFDRCLKIYTTAFDKRERFDMEYRLRHASGEYRWIQDLGTPSYNSTGEFSGYIGHCFDITERKQAEEQFQKNLVEKEFLLRELHHRTKNNMGVIIALLNLQADDAEDEHLKVILKETQLRVRSMALVHQKLYEGQDLSYINLKDYIKDLSQLLMDTYQVSPGKLLLELNVEDVFVLIDTAIPCGMILNELISNALKHAFPNGVTGKINIHLHKLDNAIIQIAVIDDGIGFPPGFDPNKSRSLGMQLIRILGENQLNGKIEFETHQGVTCYIQFRDDLYQPRI